MTITIDTTNKKINKRTVIVAGIILILLFFSITYYLKTKILSPLTLETQGVTATVKTTVGIVNVKTNETTWLYEIKPYAYNYTVGKGYKLEDAKFRFMVEIKYSAKDVANVVVHITNIALQGEGGSDSLSNHQHFLISGKVYKSTKSGSYIKEFTFPKTLDKILRKYGGDQNVKITFKVKISGFAVKPDGSPDESRPLYDEKPVSKTVKIHVAQSYVPEPSLQITSAQVIETGYAYYWYYWLYNNIFRVFDILP